MPISTIIYITLAAVFALGFVFFKYFAGAKRRSGNLYFLGSLRFISIFMLLLLLINPEIKQRDYEIEKPRLLLALDQSASIAYAEKADSVRIFLNDLKNNPELQEKFSIYSFGFGKEIDDLEGDSIVFTREQTNIHKALSQLDKFISSRRGATVLITDGNQTVGEDFQYYPNRENFTVFPVVVGDTVSQEDLVISNLNVNKYAFLRNRFPVEVILNYSGDNSVESTFEIREGDVAVFSQPVGFDPENSSKVITANLPANSLGTRVYEAVVAPLDSEKNINNNLKKFAVEVIDERTSVLILTAITHPDLGMLKTSIEQNEQREARIENIKNIKELDVSDFQLIILYQPNKAFKGVFDEIRSEKQNYFLITGSETDWNFVNSVQSNLRKNYSSQSQEVFPIYNPDYTRFQFENIGFDQFPPLEDAFGSLALENENMNILLYQEIEGIPTELPLLATQENNSTKLAVLFGENTWKWRSQDYINNRSFEQFDTFLGKLVQYLSATQKKDRLTFDAEPFYLENEDLVISAQYFDQNYQFNPNGELLISITNNNNEEVVETQMLLDNNQYKININDLYAGDYTFEIREQISGISRSGNFAVLEYNVEQQFTSANLSKLKAFADNQGQYLNYLNNSEELASALINDDDFVAVQKIREKTVPLLHWKILLALLISSLGAEWFGRKYFGLI